MITIKEALNEAYQKLKNRNIESYKIDAQILLYTVLNTDRVFILSNGEKELSKEDYDNFTQLIKKREEKIPIAYLISKGDFMGIDLVVESGVLIPRGETEILVEVALEFLKDKSDIKVLDMCAGSGCVGIAIAMNNLKTQIIETDISNVSKKIVNINVDKYDLKDRVQFVSSDLFENIDKKSKFDIIVSNPPYIETEEINNLMEDVKNYEPHIALDGGNDGLQFYRKITKEAGYFLKENGMLAFETGYKQGKEVESLLKKNGYKNIKILKDLSGHDRIVHGIKK